MQILLVGEGILLCIATLRGVVGSGAPSVHYHIARCSGKCASFNALPLCMGQWEVVILVSTTSLHGQWAVGLLRCTAALHGAVGGRDLAVQCLYAWGTGQWGSFSTLPLGMGQWVVGIF